MPKTASLLVLLLVLAMVASAGRLFLTLAARIPAVPAPIAGVR
jgi:hypothetical protein